MKVGRVRIRGPVLTLLVGVVIAAVLLIVSDHAKSSPTYGASMRAAATAGPR